MLPSCLREHTLVLVPPSSIFHLPSSISILHPSSLTRVRKTGWVESFGKPFIVGIYSFRGFFEHVLMLRRCHEVEELPVTPEDSPSQETKNNLPGTVPLKEDFLARTWRDTDLR